MVRSRSKVPALGCFMEAAGIEPAPSAWRFRNEIEALGGGVKPRARVLVASMAKRAGDVRFFDLSWQSARYGRVWVAELRS